MPSLSSFISSNQYSTENTTKPLYAGMLLGTAYAGVTFNGASGSAGNDPGGIFGWLIYSRRYKYTPQKGTTGDQYIVYTNPQDFVADLNKLSGITYFMISNVNSGGTYGLFENTGVVNRINRIRPTVYGYDFLQAIEYLAYGGNLVITGTTGGFTKYQNDTNISLDAIIGQCASAPLCQWLITNKFTTGIFPTLADSSGIMGSCMAMADYATLFGNSSYVSGTTVANRIFNVYGVNSFTNLTTSTLLNNSQASYDIPAACDVGGFFTRSKNKNQLYLTVAGINLSKLLNGTVKNAIDWDDTIKDTLRANRLNFFVTASNTPIFLGGDLVGATYGGSVNAEDRIGVVKLKSAITQDLTNIGLKYLFQPNDAATRSHVTSEIKTALSKYAQFIFTNVTQVTCDSTNNTDYETSLNMSVVVQPILALDSFEVSVTVTQ